MSLVSSLLVLSSLLAAQADTPPPGFEGCRNITIGDDNRGEDSYASISRTHFYHPDSLPLINIKDSCNMRLRSLQLQSVRTTGNKTHSLQSRLSDAPQILVREEVTVCRRGVTPPAYLLQVQNFVFSPVVAVCSNDTCGGCGKLWVSTVQYCTLVF